MSAAEASDCSAKALSFLLNQLSLAHLSLKKEQHLAMKAIYKRRDVFVWLSTGYRKSLCYQSIPFVMDYKLGLKGSSKYSEVLYIALLLSLSLSLSIQLFRVYHHAYHDDGCSENVQINIWILRNLGK